MRSSFTGAGPVVSGLVIITWVVLVFRLLPPVNADYGMFVTVAERLRAGDRLYADVYENKDPLFHYSLALARSITPFGGWLLQIAWVLVCSVATYALAAGRGMRPRSAVLVAFFAAPVIVTGSAFFPGTSHLPAVAIMLVAVAALLADRWMIAGIALGALVFFKLVFLLPAVLVLGVLLWRSPRRTTLRAVAVALVTMAVIATVMILRTELGPYLQTLYDNVAYANGPQGAKGLAAIVDHLQRVLLAPGNLVLVLTTLTLLAAVAAARPRTFSGLSPRSGDPLAWIIVALVSGGVLVIAFTGLWQHHGQVFVVPGVLALVLAAAALPDVFGGLSVSSLVTVCLTTYLLSALVSPMVVLNQLEYARANINSQLEIPASAGLIISTGEPTTYARVGDGLDDGHSFGLGDWTLACPRFGQSIWEDGEILESTLSCLPSADVIYVTPSIKPDPTDPEWSAFLEGVDAILADGYQCVQSDAGRACRRVAIQ